MVYILVHMGTDESVDSRPMLRFRQHDRLHSSQDVLLPDIKLFDPCCREGTLLQERLHVLHILSLGFPFPVLRIVRSIWFGVPGLGGSSPWCSCHVAGWGCSHLLWMSCSHSYLEEPCYVPQAQLGEHGNGIFCVMC